MNCKITYTTIYKNTIVSITLHKRTKMPLIAEVKYGSCVAHGIPLLYIRILIYIYTCNTNSILLFTIVINQYSKQQLLILLTDSFAGCHWQIFHFLWYKDEYANKTVIKMNAVYWFYSCHHRKKNSYTNLSWLI